MEPGQVLLRNAMNFIDILKLYNSNIWSGRLRLVRHADDRWDLDAIVRSGHFDAYQSNQGRDIFPKTDHIVSFMGEAGTRSRFMGVYRLEGVSTTARSWPKGYPYPEMKPGKFWYELKRLREFDELADRLIIDWGSGTRSWVQWLKRKEVIEILPKGHVRDFPGFDDVVLGFDDLRRVIENRDANRTWHTMLGSVAGVYLITDTVDGSLYVGSAYGQEGILGRWTSYVKSKHGGNVKLKELLSRHPERHRSFQYSILRTLPRSMTKHEVVAVETTYKKKLGSRAFGLSGN